MLHDLIERIPSSLNSGLIGASKSLYLAKLSPSLIITPTVGQALKLKAELELILEKEVLFFPPLDTTPGEGILPGKEIVSSRLEILKKWFKREPSIVVAPIKAVMIKTSKTLQVIELVKGKEINREALIHNLIEFGFKRLPIVGERGEFSIRGGIIDIYSGDLPIRIELSGDEIESIRTFDSQTQRSISDLSAAEVLAVSEKHESSIFHFVPKESLIVIDEPVQVSQNADKFYEEAKDFGGEKNLITYDSIVALKPKETTSFLLPGDRPIFSSPPSFQGRINELKEYLNRRNEIDMDENGDILSEPSIADLKTYIITNHKERLEEELLSNGKMQNVLVLRSEDCSSPPRRTSSAARKSNTFCIKPGELSAGFVYLNGKIQLLTDYEIFGKEFSPKRKKGQIKEGINEELLADLKVGDYVVHENYGIGMYKGMEHLEETGGEHLLIEYLDGDRLYVPLTMLGLVEKYSAGEYKPRLSRLGTKTWINTKEKAKKSIQDMTKDLLALYSERLKVSKAPFAPDDVWQREIEMSFPYNETRDQLKAIADVKKDMESTRPMDRLVCGDVGYGKTEVAIRAALKAIASGKQVAVLVPTTILAEQHFHNFSERLKTFPFTVQMLSRFRSEKDKKQIVQKLAIGGVDVIIGTHRLLSKDIKFSNLGLLIVDEEQRFGVGHKEKIKQFKKNVDVITLTATPVPRTLYFSLSGIRDLSIINTPPLDRSPVRTYVLPWNQGQIREAILRELDRGGQIYFVYNKVSSMDGMAAKLKKLVPEARIGIGHGQMDGKTLEKTMLQFMNHEFDVLLCSTIIESGIDIQNVNTVIIDEADRFGLSQLYQLRGRVGRGPVRAYAYLFYHPEKILSTTALDRLKAIQEFTALGSGYKLAMRDLEIRGSGNLLGAEQSGHMMSIGFDLYTELLEEAVRAYKGIIEPTPRQVEIDLKTDSYIPSSYVEDERQRIALYRRLNLLNNMSELSEIKLEIKDRFGALPIQLKNLLEVIDLKVKAQEKGIKSIKEIDNQIRIEYFNGNARTFKKRSVAEIVRLI